MNTYSLLNILADGSFHSGTDIGIKLGLSRASVWKGVRELEAAGLRVDSVRGKGYRLTEPLVLLDPVRLREHMPAQIVERFALLDVHFSVDSTNLEVFRSFAARVSQSDRPDSLLCLAEMQSGGRGRRGRRWVSPLGTSLSFSLGRRFCHGLEGLESMSLVTGLSLVRTLTALGISGAQLKWPNDVMLGGRKLAGILLEMKSGDNGDYQVVFGVGVNISPDDEFMQQAAKPWASLAQYLPGPVDRNRLAALLATELIQAIDALTEKGFSTFIPEWSALDCTLNEPVDVHLADGSVISGIARGVAASGALRVETASGERQFTGGEVSLRPASGIGC